MEFDLFLKETAREAGGLLRDKAFDYGLVEWKAMYDPVTTLDRRVEELIKERVLGRMPANFVGEEFGKSSMGEADYTWYIDPIDGTKSFVRGEFESSLSIAVEEKGELIAGCVYDFMRDIMYLEYRGRKEMLGRMSTLTNGLDIRPIKRDFGEPRILVDGSNERLEQIFLGNPYFSILKKPGSMALAMAQVAFGIYDGLAYYNRNKGHAWDIAAGYYMLEEDCSIRDMDGKEFDYRDPKGGIIAIRRDCENFEEISKLFNQG